MSRRLAFPLAVAAVAAVVALPAAAQTGPTPPTPPPGPPGNLQPCAQGQDPAASPCLIAPCAEGQQPSQESPCIPMPPMPPMPGGGGGDGGGPVPGEPPALKGGFVSHVWRFTADADAYDADANVLNATITKILNLPKRFADQDDPFVDSDSYILFSATTKVFGSDGRRVTRETRYDGLLDDADTVSVVGKVVPPEKWREDEDGTPTPTIRAKRVTVTG